jgi:peptidyl-tRNA hydrolase, PTH1 family
MKIIVGLGNPGKKYERTRHNAGFMAIDELARSLHLDINHEKYSAFIAKAQIDEESTILTKPLTYMNDSGRAISAILRDTYVGVNDLIVLHDELDLPLGSVRIKINGGHGGHNGLRSIIELVGSSDFTRVRLGIGRPAPGMDAADYVLSPFLSEERILLPDVMARAAEAVRVIILEGPSRAMNIFNQK